MKSLTEKDDGTIGLALTIPISFPWRLAYKVIGVGRTACSQFNGSGWQVIAPTWIRVIRAIPNLFLRRRDVRGGRFPISRPPGY